jgi:hypothetical protein
VAADLLLDFDFLKLIKLKISENIRGEACGAGLLF